VNEKNRLNSIKHHLYVLVKRGKRVVAVDKRIKWWPGSVFDPGCGEYFTTEGAWEFIAEQLNEKGTIIKQVPLKKLPGSKAYELNIPTYKGKIYIKISFGGKGDTVIGHSFHYSGQK